MGNWQLVLGAQNVLCGIRLAEGDLDSAIAVGDKTLALSQQSGELWVRSYVLGFLSEAHWRRGDRELAETYLKEGIACKHALHDLSAGMALLVETMAWIASERGAAETAGTLLGCADRFRELATAPIFEPRREQHESSVSSAREQLGDAAYAAAFKRGKAMSIEEAVAYALDQKKHAKPALAGAAEAPLPVTRRELEIARLIADGMTTREIASKLFISDRTVETHVTNMLNKLGLGSWIQLTRWVVGLEKS